MTWTEYFSERMSSILIKAVSAIAGALFLKATGTQTGIIILLLIYLLFIVTITQISDFLKLRARFHELESIIDGLDKKYLFAECMPAPRTAWERRIFHLLRRSCKSMTETVSDAESSLREYREYIESQVHEIKAPITAARLICQTVGPETRQKLLLQLTQIEAHTERALYYARSESPEKDFLIRKISLSELISQAIANYKTLLIQSGIRIETGSLDYTVYTDDKWACFILGQLLQNSARYHDAEPLITLSAAPIGNQVQLTVRDNGIGIPAHELPRIFERGFTGSNGRNRGGSTGMGLYLCRKLAGFLEIDLNITSEEQAGTSVFLTFPAQRKV